MTRSKARAALTDITNALAAYDEAGAECPVKAPEFKRRDNCPKCQATARDSCGLQASATWHFVMAVRAALSEKER